METETAASPLSRALRETYERAGLSQPELSRRTGIDQSLISKYARGKNQPPLDVLLKVEEACGQPRGHILRLAGYVEPADTRTAILTDPSLSPEHQEHLIAIYDGFRALSAPASPPG